MLLRLLFFTLLFSNFLPAAGASRVWTDIEGRTITADLVRVEADTVVLHMGGRDYEVPLARLIPPDREAALKLAGELKKGEEQNGVPAGASGVIVNGTPVPLGATTAVLIDFNADEIRRLSREDRGATQARLGLHLPPNFDPGKRHDVLVVRVTGSGNGKALGHFTAINDFDSVPAAAGWVVMSFDLPSGTHEGKSHDAVFRACFRVMEAAWPDVRSWTYSAGGYSGGAKSAFYQLAQLASEGLPVAGLFLGGCNQDFSEKALKEYRVRSTVWRSVKVFISNGRNDPVSTPDHAERVAASVRSNGPRQVRKELFDGGHVAFPDHVRDALQWFASSTRGDR